MTLTVFFIIGLCISMCFFGRVCLDYTKNKDNKIITWRNVESSKYSFCILNLKDYYINNKQ